MGYVEIALIAWFMVFITRLGATIIYNGINNIPDKKIRFTVFQKIGVLLALIGCILAALKLSVFIYNQFSPVYEI